MNMKSASELREKIIKTRDELKRAKQRSNRAAELRIRLRDMVLRQLKSEIRAH